MKAPNTLNSNDRPQRNSNPHTPSPVTPTRSKVQNLKMEASIMLPYAKRMEKMLQDFTNEAGDNSNINSGQVANLQTHRQKVTAQNKIVCR